MNVVPSFQRSTVTPSVDPDSAWWWEALANGKLLLPRCDACGLHFFPPMLSCPTCGSRTISPVEASGVGWIYSWVVVHHSLDPGFAADAPYTIVAVKSKEGARLFGRLAPGDVPVADAAVEAVAYEVDGVRLLGFRKVAQ